MIDECTPAGSRSCALRSVLVVVSDLDRSAKFYEEALPLVTSWRKGEVAVLSAKASGSPTILLRQAFRNARRAGQQDVGLRAVAFNVGELEALDDVERRVRMLGAFDGRSTVGAAGHCDIVRAHDPDRVPLAFFCVEGELSPDDLEILHVQIYAL